MSVLLTMDIARRISRLSLATKIVSTTVALISTAMKRILLAIYENMTMLAKINTVQRERLAISLPS